MSSANRYDDLARVLALTDDLREKQAFIRELYKIARQQGVFFASIHNLYKACGERKCSGFTVPAVNLRCMTYEMARAIFRIAIKNKAGAFIFEIARSEMGYTHQPPVEYAGSVLAAALREGFQGPIFIQGDHFQFKQKPHAVDPDKELASLRQLMNDAVAAGFFNIDIDTSTLVDLEKADVKEQQRLNFEVCAKLTEYLRSIEPEGLTIAVGGEIGEVGGTNSTEEELRAFMEGYLEHLPPGMEGISKISIQTGTSHGGVVLPDGKVAQVKVDFDTLARLSRIARDVYRLGGAVQHGASTLPSGVFGKFVECGAIEVHLATQFQNMIFDSTYFPSALREKMYNWIKRNCGDERGEGQTENQFLYKTRKKAWGPFKKELFDLPADVKEGLSHELEARFDFLFKQLKINETRSIVHAYIKPIEIEIGRNKATAVLDGQGDD